MNDAERRLLEKRREIDRTRGQPFEPAGPPVVNPGLKAPRRIAAPAAPPARQLSWKNRP
jgi:hypothetical protein